MRLLDTVFVDVSPQAYPNAKTGIEGSAVNDPEAFWGGGGIWEDRQNYCERLKGFLSATTTPEKFKYAENGKDVELNTLSPDWQPVEGNYIIKTEIGSTSRFCAVFRQGYESGSEPAYNAIYCGRVVSTGRPEIFASVFNQTLKDMRDCLLPEGWEQTSTDQGACYPSGIKRGECRRIFTKTSRNVWLFSNLRNADWDIGIQTYLGPPPVLAPPPVSHVEAQPFKLTIGCTAATDCTSAIVARDNGIFAAHGLDVDLRLIGNDIEIPTAIVSGSVQIGATTAPVFLQAVDSGLDFAAIEGGSVMGPSTDDSIAAVARTGVTIKDAKDFIGKKVGVPGIDAFLHILFRKWLIERGVDPKGVNFVEVPFPTMNDALKSGAVDAVLTAEPFITSIKNAGNGDVAVRYVAELGRGDPVVSYVSTHSFEKQHFEVVNSFRASIEEAAVIVNSPSDREQVSQSISKFTKMPIELVRLNRRWVSQPQVRAYDFAWWIDAMKQQGILHSDIDVDKVMIKHVPP
jgi:NitT/TauT family transport system substrate-binding protein